MIVGIFKHPSGEIVFQPTDELIADVESAHDGTIISYNEIQFTGGGIMYAKEMLQYARANEFDLTIRA